ncbi:uncharacterized protein DFL_008088 [Arthrobotrys flagrans]|uniref:Uncharacterized protein n=1 Tax=Arthrobotrys flagrans TaxID=97331 RepID=A0A436ZMT2_ARTFL|nr:hypothetical protein DFL_008088 [Arthrobotrys flagrans]
MPPAIQTQCLSLIQANRKSQDNIRVDAWVRSLLKEHFADINEHCDDIASGRITKPIGNNFVLSLAEPSTLGFRRFWIDCVIGNQEKHNLARRPVDQFVNIVVLRSHSPKGGPLPNINAPITGLPMYRKVSEKISGKLDELICLGRYMAGMVKDIETIVLQLGMRYKPPTRREHEIVDEVIWWASPRTTNDKWLATFPFPLILPLLLSLAHGRAPEGALDQAHIPHRASRECSSWPSSFASMSSWLATSGTT